MHRDRSVANRGGANKPLRIPAKAARSQVSVEAAFHQQAAQVPAGGLNTLRPTAKLEHHTRSRHISCGPTGN